MGQRIAWRASLENCSLRYLEAVQNLDSLRRIEERINMLFMIVATPKPDKSRKEIIDRLTTDLHPETWELIRHGNLSNIYYTDEEKPGFFALLNARSPAEAKALVENGSARLDQFTLVVHPVRHFPNFEE